MIEYVHNRGQATRNTLMGLNCIFVQTTYTQTCQRRPAAGHRNIDRCRPALKLLYQNTILATFQRPKTFRCYMSFVNLTFSICLRLTRIISFAITSISYLIVNLSFDTTRVEL